MLASAFCSLATTVAVSVVGQTGSDGSGLCYEMRLSGTSGTQRYAFAPITGFPAQHVLVQQPVCGYQVAPGDPIPHSGNWSQAGDSTNTGSCSAVGSGELFYAYHFPDRSSSNTGFEQDRAVVIYFVVDEADEMSLVLTFDRPNNGNGGRIQMNIDAPALTNHPVEFKLRDDSFEPSCAGSTCQWPSNGVLSGMTWDWASCCTDGMALGNLPAGGFNLPFEFTQADGIDIFKLAQWDSETNTISFVEVDKDIVMNSGFSLGTTTCAAYCEARTSCGACSLDPNCGWCASTMSCLSVNTANSSCPESINYGSSCCVSCTTHTSCATCAAEPGCAFDHISGRCISALVTGDQNTTYCTAEIPPYVSLPGDTCLTCPGAVSNNGSTTGVLDFCSGHGTCSWETRQCTCDSGWGGPACDVECPGGVNNTCNGNGVCSSLGTCTCNCGWTGVACEETGCPCNADTNNLTAVCTIGNCNQVCGSRLADSSCTGSAAVNDTCSCIPGWWGGNCTATCPGIDPMSGVGAICGGHGVCSTATGACTCDACYSIASDGTCTEDSDIVCLHNGQPACVMFPPVNGTMQKGCNCIGMWTGLNCNICSCPAGVTCNSIDGTCDYTTCNASQYTASPGNSTHDTICAAISLPCANFQFEAVAPTSTSDRVCQNLTAPCDFPDYFELAAPTSSSDRNCSAPSLCNIDDGNYETVAPTPTSDTTCSTLTVCAIGVEYETVAPTNSSNRQCSPLTICTAQQYISVIATYNSDRNCSALTVCNYTSEYDITIATSTSDRVCSALSAECDPLGVLDLVETLPPTTTSDRECGVANDCESAPCENGATCIDGVHSYTCQCAQNYVGTNCSSFDACTVGPCNNGAVCSTNAETGAASCTCAPEFSGACCSIESDESLRSRKSADEQICMNASSAETRFNGNSDNSGNTEASTSVGTIIGLVVALAAMLVIIIAAIIRRRDKEDVDNVDISNASGVGGGFNPLYALQEGKQAHQQPVYDALNPSSDLYGAKIAERRAEYADAVGVDDEESAYALGASDVNDSTYDSGANDVTYDIGQGDDNGIYRVAQKNASGEILVPDTYETAHHVKAPEYGVIGSETEYANRSALQAGKSASEGTYGIREGARNSADIEDVYGLAGRDSDDGTYACNGLRANESEGIYGRRANEDGIYESNGQSMAKGKEEEIYGLGVNNLSEELYANRADAIDSGKDDGVYGLRNAKRESAIYANESQIGAKSESLRSITLSDADFLGPSNNADRLLRVAFEKDCAVGVVEETSDGYLSLRGNRAQSPSDGDDNLTLSRRSQSYDDALHTVGLEESESLGMLQLNDEFDPPEGELKFQLGSVHRKNPAYAKSTHSKNRLSTISIS